MVKSKKTSRQKQVKTLAISVLCATTARQSICATLHTNPFLTLGGYILFDYDEKGKSCVGSFGIAPRGANYFGSYCVGLFKKHLLGF